MKNSFINRVLKENVKRLIKKCYMLHVYSILKMFSILNYFGIITFYQPLPQLKLKTNEARTKRAYVRWDAIRKELTSENMSVLDIGCNVGFYCTNIAKMNNFVTGIDNHIFSLLLFYIKEALKIKNLAISNHLLSPNNMKSLPSYDCVLLLSVFHHWCRAYGTEKALNMLDDVYRKTNKILFFETAQTDTASEVYRSVLPNMGNSPEEWIHNYFLEKSCRKVKTISYIRGRYLVAIFK